MMTSFSGRGSRALKPAGAPPTVGANKGGDAVGSTNRARSRAGRWGLVALAAVVLVGVSSCASGGPSTTPVPTASIAASTCVSDPGAVIAATPTAVSTTAALPAALTASLDAAARSSFAQAAAPGAIVGVRTPQGTWTAAYGIADPGTGAPMTLDMHTRIGSVTKTFTGTLIMQLAEEGKLSLDDTIGKYIPGIPNGDIITLRQLADMTSGVASYTKSPAFTDVYFAKPETIFTPTELVAVGIANSPIFEPGTQFDYSNTNIVLLGLVVEKVTGMPVEQVLADKIFGPLKLTSTSWPGDQTDLPAPYAHGFTLQGDFATAAAPSDATNWNPAWGFTAGELISNVADMLTYDRALGTGQGLLGAASQTERLTSFPGAGGYGLGMVCADGWVGHTGTVPGYTSYVFYQTATDTSLVVLANSDIASGVCDQSPTLTDDPGTAVCLTPAARMFAALSTALGNPFTPNATH
ncbi:MAG: class beta-lactamase-related serine hydrolase [Subtercola sp.]|nr:class beta-lactamase-related serine hydrolase [Subtercola sp.]